MESRTASQLISLQILLCLIVLILGYVRVMYAFGACILALLTILLLITVECNIARNEVDLYKKRNHSNIVKITAVLALIFNFVAFVLLLASPLKNGADIVMKPAFHLVLVQVLIIFLYVHFIVPTSEDIPEVEAKADVENNGTTMDEPTERSFGSKLGVCCRECCLWLLLLLVVVANLQTFFLFSQEVQFDFEVTGQLDPSEISRFLVSSSTENPDQKMAFRCAGEGNPVVVFHHGFRGSALDFSHVFNDLRNVTKVCSFDRQGYGQSKVFGESPRIGETFALESHIAFEELGLLEDGIDLLFVGHSMAGFNMRAFDIAFPGVVKGMVLVDPVIEPEDDNCVSGGADFLATAGQILNDAGLSLLLTVTGLIQNFAPIDFLPEDVQAEYIAQNIRTDVFETQRLESIELFGETCAFAATKKTLEFPVTIIIPEKGIHEGNIEAALSFSNRSSVLGKSVLVEGDDAFHVDMVFRKKFADVITTETLKMLDVLTVES